MPGLRRGVAEVFTLLGRYEALSR